MSDERLFQDYKYDVFISYTHDDDDPMPGEARGWVSWLHEYLEKRLKTILTKPPMIWRDKQRMNPGDLINETLVSGVTNSAILLAVISPRYMRSKYCKEELWSFYRYAEQKRGLRLENEMRIIKVAKYPVELNEYPVDVPSEVKENLLGFDCYRLDKESKTPIAFHTKRDEIEFSTKCEYLVQIIKQMVERISAQTAASPAIEVRTTPTGEQKIPPAVITVKDPTPIAKTVYLAETSSNFDSERAKIKSELLDHGFVVLPEAPFSRLSDANAIKAQIREHLRCSRLSVHTVGDVYAFSPEKSGGVSIEEIQYELAAECAHDLDFARIVWLPPKLQIAEEEHKQAKFIQRLREDAGIKQRDDLLDGKILEEVKTLIRDRLKPKPALKDFITDTEGIGSDETQTFVYLICDREDYDRTEQLKEEIYAQGGIPLQADLEDDAKFIKSHNENLELCDGVMIYYGEAKDAWAVRNGAAVDKFKIKRRPPLLPKAFYLARPQTQQKAGFKYPGAVVIRCYDGPQPEAIKAFFNQIKQAKRGAL